jgi:hypothetical protein
VFTAALFGTAIAQVGLFWVQLRYLREAAIDTRQAAQAALLSAETARDEFNTTHRPELIVHDFEVARKPVEKEGYALSAQFTVVNKGTANATIEEIKGRIFFAEYLRPGVSLKNVTGRYKGHPLAAGETLENVGIALDPVASAGVDFESGFGTRDGPPLWCIGRITYEDTVTKRRRETGFCRSYDFKGERWRREPQSEFEYSY